MHAAWESLSEPLNRRLDGLEDQVQDIFAQVPFGSHRVGADGLYLSINDLELAWLGRDRNELIGRRRPLDFLTPASQQLLTKQAALHGAAGFAGLELDMVNSRGDIRPVSMSCMPARPGGSPLQAHRAVVFDLSERRARLESQRMAALSYGSPTGICITDGAGAVLQMNPAFCTLTGYSADEWRGRTMQLLSATPESNTYWAALWRDLLRKGHWQGEVKDRRKDGSVFISWLSLSAISPRKGAASRYVATLHDITAHRASQEEIRHLAFFDPLTQLPNRRLLLERLSASLAVCKRHGGVGALLFVDMDNFKVINDTRGHGAGDLLLVEVATRLQDSVRQGDTVARLGGDEFVVLLNDLNADTAEAERHATQVGRKTLAALSMPYRIQEIAFSTSASIGITLMTGAQTVSELLQQSDLAMYEAKRAGRNTLCVFHAAMQAAATVHAEVEQELWRALEQSQFELHYQPQFDAQQRVVAAEALLRWNHPTKGLVLPGAFIAAAEQTGLIVPIGRWVIESACRQLARWAGEPATRHIVLAVNVSARQFGQADFVAHLSHSLQAEGADARLLTLELTETTVHDVDDIRLKMLALQNLGVRFSMDDFGIGHSSLVRLIQLPVSQLKIDRSFVRDMASSPAAAVVVHTIIGMARNLGMEVIAEGVETQAQLVELHQAGCPLFQGYLMSPSVPVADFDSRLRRSLPAP